MKNGWKEEKMSETPKKYFYELSGARSTQKLDEIHNIIFKIKHEWVPPIC